MINLPPNSGNNSNIGQLVSSRGNTTAGKSTATNESSTVNASQAKNIAIKSLLLRQIQQGQTVSAKVNSSQLLSQNDKSLLQKLNPNLSQHLAQATLKQAQTSTLNNNNPTSTGLLRQNINTNNVLTNTNLYLTKLSVNQQSSTAQVLTTITPHQLTKNAVVLLTQNNGELSVSPQRNQQIQSIASELAKLNLPKQQPVNQIQQFADNISKLPPTIQKQLFSTNAINSNLLQSLKSLTAFTHSDKTLLNANQVKNVLINSGVQLEAKLNQQQTLNQDIRNTINKISTLLSTANNLTKSGAAAVDNKAIIPTENVAVPLTKAGEGLSTKELDKILTQLLSQQSSTGTIQTNHNQQTIVPNTTTALFRLLGLSLPPDSLQKIPIPLIIERHLKKLIEQTQARIQMNQLQSLGLDKTGMESRTSILQQFHTEIALRFNEQIMPLQITIQEQEHSKKEENQNDSENRDDSSSKKEKRWQVFLSFDLPNEEKLHTQLTIIDNSISATLWAESSRLCNKANQEINILRDKLLANGLIVEDIACLQGKPLQQEFELGYNLVDITT